LFPEFVFQICWEFELPPNRTVVPFDVVFSLAKFGKIWTSIRSNFVFSKIEQLYLLEKIWIIGKQVY
jgi:hypothetical protein